VFNYVFDPPCEPDALPKIFHRIHRALRPGGVFLFDLAGPARMDGRNHAFRQGKDWAILLEREYDRERLELTRHMTVFRKRGNSYRRSQETHKQKLYAPALVAEELRAAGFRARHLQSYGKMKLPRGLGGFLGIAKG
jgi:SAM-dependent methyltransferase